jgi:hypothetical protein
MRLVLVALVLAGCASSPEPGSIPGAGGKADGDSPDGGVDAASAMLTGTCTVSTTEFSSSYGTTDTTTEPIALDIRIDHVNDDATVLGVVRVASPWGSIPDGLWRGWCHLAHQDFQPLDSACAIGPYDIRTAALGFGEGFVSFKQQDAGYSLYISAGLEIGRDSYYDSDWTKVRYSCSLQ